MLAGLSAFYGGFSAAAAQAVAETTLEVLAALVEHSLLRHGADGRFQLYELVRQFAGEKLAAAPQHEAATREQHSRYYLALLKSWNNAFVEGPRATPAPAASEDIVNIHAAWNWAGARCDIAAIEQALEPLANFYQNCGRYQQGQIDLASTAAHLATSDRFAAHIERRRIYAQLLGRQGLFCYLLGDYDAASSYLEQACRRHKRRRSRMRKPLRSLCLAR